MTLSEIRKKLTDAGIDNAAMEASILLEAFEQVPRARLFIMPKDTDYTSPALREAVEKRCTRYPLQYLLGSWNFMGLELDVSEACLIPRSDTEVLAEEAARLLPPGGRLLDLCTGSGCIAAAVLSMTERTTGTAVELYPETAALARHNLEKCGLDGRCTVLAGDAAADLFPPDVLFDVITANPPYVTAGEMEELEPELAFEPVHALTDGGDGLSLLRAIVTIYRRHLSPGGVMLLEHGWKQAPALADIAASAAMTYRCLYDYGGRPRAACLMHREQEEPR